MAKEELLALVARASQAREMKFPMFPSRSRHVPMRSLELVLDNRFVLVPIPITLS